MESCEDDETFFSLLERFYVKAEEKNIKMRPNLDFMIKISDNIDEIKLHFEAPAKEYISNEKRNQFLKQIPKNLKINENDAQKLLFREISSINYVQTTRLIFQNINICGEIAFKPPHKYDKDLHEFFEQWVKNSISKKHVKRVKKQSKFMRLEYSELHDQFTEEMKMVDKIRANIEMDMTLASSLFEKLIEATDSNQIDKITIETESVLSKINSQQYDLIENLRNVSTTLNKYNRRRIVWEEVLIGMRKSLRSQRKPLKKIVLKYFSNDVKREPKGISFKKFICGTKDVLKF